MSIWYWQYDSNTKNLMLANAICVEYELDWLFFLISSLNSLEMSTYSFAFYFQSANKE